MSLTILEPYSKISSYDSLARNAEVSIMGSIVHNLFPDDRTTQRKFKKSKIGLENKRIILDLVSEAYGFINNIISEHADPESYYFRIHVTIYVNKKGKIIGKPTYILDVLKYVGRLGGEYYGETTSKVRVNLITHKTLRLNDNVNDALKLLNDNISINFEKFKGISKIPYDYKDKLNENKAYLVIKDSVYEILFELNNNIMINYIIDDGKKVTFNTIKDVISFVLSKLNLLPSLSEFDMAFQYSDSEIQQIENDVTKYISGSDIKADLETEIITKIGKLIEKIDNEIEKISEKDFSEEINEKIQKLINGYEQNKADFNHKKIEITAQKEEFVQLREDFEAQHITYEIYATRRMLGTTNLHNLRSDLTEIFNYLDNDILEYFITINKTKSSEK